MVKLCGSPKPKTRIPIRSGSDRLQRFKRWNFQQLRSTSDSFFGTAQTKKQNTAKERFVMSYTIRAPAASKLGAAVLSQILLLSQSVTNKIGRSIP